MNNLFIKFFNVLILWFLSYSLGYTQYTILPSSKWHNGRCNTNMNIILNGSAEPFSLKVINNNTTLVDEIDLASNFYTYELSTYGLFTVEVTDKLGCIEVFEVESECECDRLEYEINLPNCGTNNGEIKIIPPFMGTVEIGWIEWPSGTQAPPEDLLVINNLAKGEYSL